MNNPECIKLSLNAMATRFEIVLHGAEASRLRAAGEEALQEIEVLDRQLSFYRLDSDISRINAGASQEPVKVEPRLFGLLQTASELSRETDGAFDVTIAPLMRAWDLTGGKGRIPSEQEITQAREIVGMQQVHLNERDFTIRFKREGIKIDLGAIGKGYAVEQAAETLRENGVTSALIHGGTSTIHAIGYQPNGSPWRVAVHDPVVSGFRTDESHKLYSIKIPKQQVECIDLCDSSLSVSAVYGKSFLRDGRQYGHVIDPQTGMPSDNAILAAVWGPSATLSDAISTALLVLGKPGLDILKRSFPNYNGLVIP